ncbi:MAG: hypothetical protein DCC75_09280 [Proteobacteria bacterium]|nr:MAG: hypothetical protein DCC75_09280 [Pseudomonadota bacterium]
MPSYFANLFNSMRITRWGEYGILCSLYLARRYGSEPIGASEIAEAHLLPLQYAQQILHRLRKGGIINSTRGPHGGFTLSKDPSLINLKEILYAAEGDTFEVICESDPVYPHECSFKVDCGLKFVWRDLKGAVDTLLESRTLAQVLALVPDTGAPLQEVLVPGPGAHSTGN